MLIRAFDLVIAVSIIMFAAPILIILLMLGMMDTGKPLFMQERVGKHKQLFKLVKFRTMHPSAASVATHLADTTKITRFGRFLRNTKLDELPQLWNVLRGEMSIVGPRPCLPTQETLIKERSSRGVYDVRPGITGLAQINKTDMSTPTLLARTDAEMINSFSAWQYAVIIWYTALGKGYGDRTIE